jgi:peptidoglycan/xylan/chitin deacetylase (PgdA/CDA1 family)
MVFDEIFNGDTVDRIDNSGINNPAIINTCISPNLFALTFDDGPDFNTEALLGILDKNNVKATFFINGINASPLLKPVLKKMFNNGHQLASHGWSHQDLATLGNDLLLEELDKNNELIKEITGNISTIIRPPYGSITNEVISTLTRLDYSLIWLNADSKDYEICNDSAFTQITKEYYSPLLNGGSLIALHHSFCNSTVYTWTQMLIDIVKQKGYRFVTIDECIGKHALPKLGNAFPSEPKPAPRKKSSSLSDLSISSLSVLMTCFTLLL